MRRSAAIRVSAGAVLAALMLLASGDTPRVSATGIPGTIHTVAGGGVGDGGPPTSALLINPSGVALDSNDNLYISERWLCRVRRVSGGVITTVAGTGICGYSGDGGPSTAAQLTWPTGIALDAVGDLYIADSYNCRVRRVSGGVITTVAGPGNCDYSGDGGAATSAGIRPFGVALDAGGDLYIADTGNCRVRRVSDGVISTVAGISVCGYSGDDGPATAASLEHPEGVVLNATGDLYITDSGNCRVRRVSSGVITTVAGNGSCVFGGAGDGGSATAASLFLPTSSAVGANGDLFIADMENCRVRRVSDGVISTVAGTGVCGYSGDGGAATAAKLSHPIGVALDTSGALYIADREGCWVRRVSGGTITTVVGGPGACTYGGDGGPATAAALGATAGVAVNSTGDIYIADYGNCRIRRVSGGIVTTVAGVGVSGSGSCGFSGDGGPATAADLAYPKAVAIDPYGDIYIADWGNCRVRRVSGGIITTVAGNGNCNYSGDGVAATAAALNFPTGVALDEAGALYIADSNNCRVRRVFGGIITTVAGTGVYPPGSCAASGDGGAPTGAGLSPWGVAFDSAGDLYIADYWNCRVRRVSGGIITTVAGSSACGFSGDGGTATAASLYWPAGLALDQAGVLYIADQENCRIRRVSGGIITTVAGTGECGYLYEPSGDGGPATAATLNEPAGVAVDAGGNLYVGDLYNRKVRIVHTSACPFDLNDSGQVTFGDLLIFAYSYNSTPVDPAWNAAADFNQSGQVTLADLILFAASYTRPAPNCPV